jgi:hypothetical protein
MSSFDSARLNGMRKLTADIINIVQDAIEQDSDFLNTIDRDRSPQMYQYFDGYINARKLDLQHLYALRDYVSKEDF